MERLKAKGGIDYYRRGESESHEAPCADESCEACTTIQYPLYESVLGELLGLGEVTTVK